MKVLFSMINYVYVYAIFLNGGILVPLVTFADAEQQGIRAVANNNHEDKSMVSDTTSYFLQKELLHAYQISSSSNLYLY